MISWKMEGEGSSRRSEGCVLSSAGEMCADDTHTETSSVIKALDEARLVKSLY